MTTAQAVVQIGPDAEFTVRSPKGALVARVGLQNGTLFYGLRDKKGRDLMLPSALGVQFEKGIPPLTGGSVWDTRESVRDVPRPRLYGEWGEQNPATAAPLRFRERILLLRQEAPHRRVLQVELRVYE